MKRILFSFICLALSGCVTRAQVNADLWLHDQIPAALCAANLDIYKYGIYRVVTCTDKKIHGCENGEKDYEEFLPYCDAHIKDNLAMKTADVEKYLDMLSKPK